MNEAFTVTIVAQWQSTGGQSHLQSCLSIFPSSFLMFALCYSRGWDHQPLHLVVTYKSITFRSKGNSYLLL